VFCGVLFLLRTWDVSVFDRDEARFALAVREMTDRGDWTVPTNFGALRFHKPILVYWLALVAQELVGRGELALRLPSALCATATVLLTVLFGRRLFGERVGWRAGWILATALVFVAEAHAFTADAALLLGTTSSFLAWAMLRERATRPGGWRLLFWLGIAWGALAKLVNLAFLPAAGAALAALEGRIDAATRRRVGWLIGLGALAVAVPHLGSLGPGATGIAFALLAWNAWRRRTERAASAGLGARWGVPLALGLLALWGVPALLRTRGAFWTLGVNQELMGQAARPFEGHVGIPGFYLGSTLLAFLPWSALLPLALLGAWRARAGDARQRFLLAWIAGPWLLLELFSSKLPHYMLVTFPALALCTSLEWERRLSSPAAPSGRWRALEAVLFGLPALGIAALAFSGVARLSPGGLRAALLATGLLALGVAAWGARRLALGRYARAPLGIAAGFAALYLCFFALVLPAVEPLRLARPLAAAVSHALRPEERLISFSVSHASVGYYLPREVELYRRGGPFGDTLRDDPRGALVVVRRGKDAGSVQEQAARAGRRSEVVGSVQGLILPRLRPQQIELVRVEPRDAG
jgi:4-amino-4-deoxy-L-arabinose transferase-like glycosyltransferase